MAHRRTETALPAEIRHRRDCAAASALTEPDAGTDLQSDPYPRRAAMAKLCHQRTKTWITNGMHGTVFALLVKTDPDAEPRHKGMSMFIARKGRGVPGRRKKLEKLGYKGIDSVPS